MNMSALPRISIIVTCYNYGRYVAQALDSVLVQGYPSCELIVVDDGSTDDAPRVLARYADRARIIRQENQGSIAAYNRGFAEASGDVIVLLDADDWLEPSALSRIAQHWRPEVSKLQWDLKIVDADGHDLGRKFCHFDSDYDERRVRESFQKTGTYRWPVSVGNAYSRWFAEKVFPLSRGYGPDGALNTVAPLYGDVVTVPEVLAAYRIHGSNQWSSRGGDFARLPRRISQRSAELGLIAVHAARIGRTAPAVSLDHELAFLNYRMMARKLGLDYPGSNADSASELCLKALALLKRERYPLKSALVHAAWFTALASSPAPAAKALMKLRFRRGALQSAIQRGKARLGRSEPQVPR
jgi:glycosyltransferase involved in cell wall biosynthesis